MNMSVIILVSYKTWLVVSTHLKNTSHIVSCPQVRLEMKNI